MSSELLIEIGTEELPPKALSKLSDAFTAGVTKGLAEAGFAFGAEQSYATPRRLALSIKDVPASQPDRIVEKKGPNLKAAYDADGKPTKAVEGFARSCDVSVDQLEQQETDKGTWLVFKAKEKGKAIADLLPAIVETALSKLPIPKRMRWGSGDVEFVRPVHWVVLMHGKNVIDCEILGVKSSNTTQGHRFHSSKKLKIASADEYEELLKSKGFVVANIEARKKIICDQVESIAGKLKGKAVMDDDLVNEVSALVEWPVAVAGEFDEDFLSVPAEALIKTMQDNQKYFPVVDKDGQLKNYFITISNIESKTPEKVKAGNERVIRPRLADAKFFWEQDLKQPLEYHVEALKNVVFQEKLGSIYDKVIRVGASAQLLAQKLDVDKDQVIRAAVLSKADLMTSMVGEFPSLQGVMGRYYAQAANEPEAISIAIEEQYMPKGAGDNTPSSVMGQILALSDRIDTLVGIFTIGQKPTGEKDPYALRRAALGVLRIILDCELDLDLKALVGNAVNVLSKTVDASAVEKEVLAYIMERLRAYYLDRNISADVFDAVSSLKPTRPLDFDKRIKAVSAFREMPEATSLAAANKRVGNILKKSNVAANDVINQGLFEEEAEKILFNELTSLSDTVKPLFDQGDYESALCKLSVLREPVDKFFDTVMVMTDDEAVRNNRIALLNKMSALFLRAADLSRLQS